MKHAPAARLAALFLTVLMTGGCFLPRTRQVPHRVTACSAPVREPETAADILRDESRDRVDYCQFAGPDSPSAADPVSVSSAD